MKNNLGWRGVRHEKKRREEIAVVGKELLPRWVGPLVLGPWTQIGS